MATLCNDCVIFDCTSSSSPTLGPSSYTGMGPELFWHIPATFVTSDVKSWIIIGAALFIISQDVDYSDCGLPSISSVKVYNSNLSRPQALPSRFLPIHHLSIILPLNILPSHSIATHCINCELEQARRPNPCDQRMLKDTALEQILIGIVFIPSFIKICYLLQTLQEGSTKDTEYVQANSAIFPCERKIKLNTKLSIYLIN
jgi:hypothetical protein